MAEECFNYLIGDIHGCYDEYLQLEEKIYKHAERNNIKAFIISVGDLIDRGPASAQVVRHFQKGFAEGTHMVIMGNHEIMMLQVLEHFTPANFQRDDCHFPRYLQTLKSKYKNSQGSARFLTWEDYVITMKGLWLSQGGYQTLQSFDCNPEDVSTWIIEPTELQFLLNMPFYYEGENFISTHALAKTDDLKIVRELSQLSDKNNEQLFTLRESSHSLLWSRVVPLKPLFDKIHVSGHTPFETVRRRPQVNCIQIDTGCVYGGKLTAYCVERNSTTSVKSAKKYLET